MQQHFATHRRHTREARDLFAFDELKCTARIPLVHQNNFGTTCRCCVQNAVTCRHVEQRCRRHEARGQWSLGLTCRSRNIASGDGFLLGHRRRHIHRNKVQNVGDRATMCQLRALRETSGARGVENRGVIILIKFDIWQNSGVGSGHDISPTRSTSRQSAIGAH